MSALRVNIAYTISISGVNGGVPFAESSGHQSIELAAQGYRTPSLAVQAYAGVSNNTKELMYAYTICAADDSPSGFAYVPLTVTLPDITVPEQLY